MSNHDVLAMAVASDTVQQIRAQTPAWSGVFASGVYITSSRQWPQPDFVISDGSNTVALAGEFKPPGQTKREYLTGLGQATAYTRDFSHSCLVIPEVADDGYPISQHIKSILDLPDYASAPIGLLTYDPALLSASRAQCRLDRPLFPRTNPLPQMPPLSESFYAKWRDASPHELGRFLEHLYDEGRVAGGQGNIRDRAFDRLWQEMTTGQTLHTGGRPRVLANTQTNKTAWGKNFRNFVTHVGWLLSDGALTDEGLRALQIVHRYGPTSRMFLDTLTMAVLQAGKHLVLVNAINQFQSSAAPPKSEQEWLGDVEAFLDAEGLLKRNPARSAAATQNVPRGFLKAEKTLWRTLELIVPRGNRVYHPARGFVFDWERITALLSAYQ